MYHPPDSLYSLWYYPGINRFADEDGNILHDLHDLFDVWQLDEWKKKKEYDTLIDRRGDLCEIYYASDVDESDFLLYLFRKDLGIYSPGLEYLNWFGLRDQRKCFG